MNFSRARNEHPRSWLELGRPDHARLRVRPGPWDAERWAVLAHDGEVRRRAIPCSVSDCGTPWYLRPHDVPLCYAHWWQWKRGGRQKDVGSWASKDSKPPVERLRANAAKNRVLDFSQLPTLVALEMRFVIGEKVTAGDWTPNRLFLDIFSAFHAAVLASGTESLLSREPEDWRHLILKQSESSTVRKDCRAYLNTFFSTLRRALVTEPWKESHWLWNGMFDKLVHENSFAHNGQNINWSQVEQPWLQMPLREWARTCLSLGTRGWATVKTWQLAAKRLSAYLSSEGLDDPALLDRSVFVDYLLHLHESDASKHALAGVNTIAAVLAAVQDEGLARYGSPVFLRHGENVIVKNKQPNPYPADIIERVDKEVLRDPLVEKSARMMLQLTRWGGLRVNELVNCPLDVLRHTPSSGHWMHYYAPKTRNFRSFPLPDDLAEQLLEHQGWVREVYGEQTEYLFPSPTRSSEAYQRARPWSASGFRNHISRSFSRNGIRISTLTGEVVTGGHIHRYRHTIGTALLNSGWTEREVQQFLGHESSQMTSHYAAILDDTLIRKVREFRDAEAMAVADTRARLPAIAHPGVERLRARFAYELPDGGCTLPASKSCDTRDNPCSGCPFFVPTGADRLVHEQRAKRLKLHIADTDDTAERELNQRALDETDRILEEYKES